MLHYMCWSLSPVFVEKREEAWAIEKKKWTHEGPSNGKKRKKKMWAHEGP